MKGSLLTIIFIISGIIFLSNCTIGYGNIEEETSPNWSANGDFLAVECYVDGPTEAIAENDLRYFTADAADICRIDVNEGKRIRLSKDQGADKYPVLSPDGTQIAYIRDDGVYVIHSDGSNQRRLVYQRNAIKEIGNVNWAPDGNQLLFSARLENADRNLYLVDTVIGTLVNLTLNNKLQNFSPMWTLNGTAVVFLASDSLGYAPSKLKVINADGSGERVIFNRELFYNFVAVSNTGKIFFTTYDLSNDKLDHLYTMNLDDKEPIELYINNELPRPSWDIYQWGTPTLSPNEKYLIYEDRGLLLLDIDTGQLSKLPLGEPIEGRPSWSPDSQKLAVTVLENTTGFHTERHIHILDIQDRTMESVLRR